MNEEQEFKHKAFMHLWFGITSPIKDPKIVLTDPTTLKSVGIDPVCLKNIQTQQMKEEPILKVGDKLDFLHGTRLGFGLSPQVCFASHIYWIDYKVINTSEGFYIIANSTNTLFYQPIKETDEAILKMDLPKEWSVKVTKENIDKLEKLKGVKLTLGGERNKSIGTYVTNQPNFLGLGLFHTSIIHGVEIPYQLFLKHFDKPDTSGNTFTVTWDREAYTKYIMDIAPYLTEEQTMEKEEVLKVGQEVVLGDLEYSVRKGVNTYFMNNKNLDNGRVFEKYGINENDLQKEVLGYVDREGVFPYCRSLEDLTKFVNAIKEKIAMKEEATVHYKLKDEKYFSAAKNLLGAPTAVVAGRWFDNKGDWKRIAEENDVLDLWFEVESTEERVDMGGFELTIKDKKVFYGEEDITWYVEKVHDWSNNAKNGFFNKGIICERSFNVDLDSVTLSRTGCVEKPSKLSDWLKVYDKIK